MWKMLATASLALALALPTQVQAANGADKSALERAAIQKAQQGRPETLGFPACSLCFSCGGVWPNFSGAFDAVATSQTTERGSACAGNLTTSTDRRPFLCCGTDQ
jgi:hypothetical protein